MAKNGTELIKATEAAKVLGISRTTFYRWIKEGIIRPKQFGKVRRYRSSEIQKLAK